MPFPAFATVTSLETERLRLRPSSPADAPAITPLISEWEVARHTARIPHPYPENGAEEWLALASAEREAGRGLSLVIEERATGRLIGCIGLETGDEEDRLEIGYWLGRPYWGRGYATEAVRALTAWALALPGVRQVHADVYPDNPASARVLEKAGFRQVGRGTRPAPARGGEKEVLLYERRAEGGGYRRPGEEALRGGPLGKLLAARMVLGWRLEHLWLRAFARPEPFTFRGERLTPFWHPHTVTWKNERAVEIPIARSLLDRARGGRVLEAGNVLSHYFPVAHEVVDKYEAAPGAIREDIVDFRSGRAYDLILCISTLEHVGWDESPRDPDKLLRAAEHLRGLLAPGGALAVTLPLGYNPRLDELLEGGRLPFTERHHYLRTSPRGWREAAWEEVCGARYGTPYPSANGLVVGICARG